MLEINKLSFHIGETPILNEVSFSVAQGERIGIIGPNGSGKTTLFNCISGFNIASSGSITYKNQNITSLSAHRRSRLGLGRVFQNFGVFREMTGGENVITALETDQWPSINPWGAKHRANVQSARYYLELVGLHGKYNAKASSLSGGQMRLLEIVRAVAAGSDLFLLDEPTAGVSPKMKGEMIKVIEKLCEMKKTVLVIEHDMNFIQKLCDRIIVLDVGKVLLDDTPENVRSNRLLHEIYFGTNGSDSHGASPRGRTSESTGEIAANM